MPNRLSQETSPYLRQHAGNPVDWYPWGEEAFRRAREEDKPIHVSVGYAACHWCHVMAHESFENPDIARLRRKYGPGPRGALGMRRNFRTLPVTTPCSACTAGHVSHNCLPPSSGRSIAWPPAGSTTIWAAAMRATTPSLPALHRKISRTRRVRSAQTIAATAGYRASGGPTDGPPFPTCQRSLTWRRKRNG